MNQVTLRLVIDRDPQTRKRRFLFYREGQGDDLVDNAADYFERVFENAAHDMIQQAGGDWIKPPKEDPPTET